MSFSITYDVNNTEVSSYSISEYLDAWSAEFGDVNHTVGNVTENNTGGFYGGTTTSGTQYAITSTNNDYSALIAEGDLTYTLFNDPAHTLYGTLDSVSLGDGLQGGGSTGTEYYLDAPQVSFDGLDITSDISEGQSGAVHQIVYGLMSGDVTPLNDALSSIFDNLDASSAFDASFAALDGDSDGTITEAEITAYADAVTTTGVADTSAELLAA
ncbi:heme acquisition protein HasA [Brenneria populi]|uniref:Heme acquisition protein HasA n=1 Tax=Brenneria populi TaxID=1505588 RepID=A0ABU6JVK8_9GAMM|nr:heme acquisition protein HasA [Brenneria populi Li et al. 2015]